MSQPKIIGVPILVYVAANHHFFASRGEEYIGASLIDFLQLKGVEAFVAEDYENASFTTPEERENICAEINKVCRFIPQQHLATSPAVQALNVLLSCLGPHFDPRQSWEDHWDALDYCSRQNDPDAALLAMALSNFAIAEQGWAGELLKQAPYEWKVPERCVMQVALSLLKDLDATYEHPGYISIIKDGIDFSFGDIDGDYSFDFSTDPNDRGRRDGTSASLSRHASATALSYWIREQIRITCGKHKVVPQPPEELHLSVAVPLDRPDLLIEAWNAGFLPCDPETTQVFIYDEDRPESPQLFEFAHRNNLEYIGVTEEGARRPWKDAPAHSPEPDILECLKEAADYLATFFEEGREHRVVRAADAAIAKATRGQ